MSGVADVCLLLEGTYPYVRGGVSAWVHQIISELSELTFSLIFLGSRRSDYEGRRYELPGNVVHLESHYLAEAPGAGRAVSHAGDAAAFAQVAALHQTLRAGPKNAPFSPELVRSVFAGLLGQGGVSRDDFLHGERAWSYIREQHLERCPDEHFGDYFWTVRSMHAPLFTLAEIARRAPRARVFHSISTGYAGLLGAFLAVRCDRPLILSEHGIYTKERTIDLAQAEWIRENGSARTMGYIRKLWIRFFEGMGKLTYQVADPIVSLYEGNRRRQITDGAPAERTVIVPNGVPVARFVNTLASRPDTVPPVVGFIGRLVPIKDIKTFIRAMGTVCAHIPEAEGWLVGSAEEDPRYARECAALVESLGLTDRVRFLGFQDVEKILPRLGLVMLTSISEALPLVILESFAAGVPAVTTDVGACRELIEGRQPEDRDIGTAGRVVSIADPEAGARAVIELLSDPDQWRAAQRAALLRVRRYYSEPMMLAAYRGIYEQALGRAGAAAPIGAP